MPELIDKNALQEALREEYDRHKALYDEIGHIERGGIVQGLSYAKMILCKQPTIDAEPVRHGRWNYRHEDDWCYCTACGTDAEGSDGECLETDYCPHCGAKMDGKFTLGSEANGCWISCAECANTGCKNRYVQEVQEDDKR